MMYINLRKIFGSKKSNTTKAYNDIPVSTDIRIIKYEQDGNTKFDISYTDPYGLGERILLRNNMDEQIFTEYFLDGNFESKRLEEEMSIEGILEYDLAREKRLKDYCLNTLNCLAERLELEAVNNKGKVYSLGNK